MNCTQCGKTETETWMSPWEPMMGPLCHSCYDEVVSCPPQSAIKQLMPESEKQALRLKALEAARAARAAKAADKKAKLAEDQARQRALNPERYDAMMAKRREAGNRLQAALKAKKELTQAPG